MADKRVINTKFAPAPLGPYSQGIAADATSALVFAAGQLPLDPVSAQIEEKEMAGQARVALKNAIAVIEGAGGRSSDIVKVTVFVVDISEGPVINEVLAELLDEPYPARTTVEVSALPRGALIEIDLIAAVSS